MLYLPACQVSYKNNSWAVGPQSAATDRHPREYNLNYAPSSSGYTSGQNIEVLYILNNRNNQNISRNYALHIKKLKQ